MNPTIELPEDVKRLLLNLESNSQQVVTEAIKSLDKIGNPDPRIIMTLRKLAGEKKNWYIQTMGSAFGLANKLSHKAEKESRQRFDDFIKNNDEMPDRDLILCILQFQMELDRKQKELERGFATRYAMLGVWFLILFFSLSSK